MDRSMQWANGTKSGSIQLATLEQESLTGVRDLPHSSRDASHVNSLYLPPMTMNILFDSWSSQVLYQQTPPTYPPKAKYPKPTGRRLNTILGAMKSYGLSTGENWEISFTDPPITEAQLKGIDVYVSLTRAIGDGYEYQKTELDSLQSFVNNGGAILLMTDHGKLSQEVPNKTVNDKELASMFAIRLENYFVTTSNYMVMDLSVDLPPEIMYLANQAPTISAHDSCIIDPPEGSIPLVCFPPNATAYDFLTKEAIPPPTPYFAILSTYGQGKIIVVGNSGLVGDYGSPCPAPGLITMEHNLMFFLNCVGFLGGLTCIPQPGQGPC